MSLQKITRKHNLIIFHNPDDWRKIYEKILQDYGMGIAVRSKMQRDLGFVYRYHKGLVPHEVSHPSEPRMHYEPQVHLDFYSEAAQSWFELKYLNL